MGRRKCTPKQLAALKRGREKLAHKRSRKTTNGWLKNLFTGKKKQDPNQLYYIPGKGMLKGQAGADAWNATYKPVNLSNFKKP